MSLSFLPKFYMMHEHDLGMLLCVNSFEDMSEDAIEMHNKACVLCDSTSRHLKSGQKKIEI